MKKGRREGYDASDGRWVVIGARRYLEFLFGGLSAATWISSAGYSHYCYRFVFVRVLRLLRFLIHPFLLSLRICILSLCSHGDHRRSHHHRLCHSLRWLESKNLPLHPCTACAAQLICAWQGRPRCSLRLHWLFDQLDNGGIYYGDALCWAIRIGSLCEQEGYSWFEARGSRFRSANRGPSRFHWCRHSRLRCCWTCHWRRSRFWLALPRSYLRVVVPPDNERYYHLNIMLSCSSNLGSSIVVYKFQSSS